MGDGGRGILYMLKILKDYKRAYSSTSWCVRVVQSWGQWGQHKARVEPLRQSEAHKPEVRGQPLFNTRFMKSHADHWLGIWARFRCEA